MTIGASNLTSSYDNVDRSTYTTASVAPTANALLLLTVLSRKASTTASAPSSVTGNDLTWVKIVEVATANGFSNLSVWRAMGAAPSAGTISIPLGSSHAGCAWSLNEFTGVDTTGTDGAGAIVQSDSYTDTGVTSALLTLAVFASSNNVAFGAVGVAVDEAITVGSGFTGLSSDFGSAINASLRTEYQRNDRTVDFSWTTSGNPVEIAIEIKEDTTAFFNMFD